MTAAPGRGVIVGASEAGLAAAETLRRSGHAGTLTLIDDEPGPLTTAPAVEGDPLRRLSP
ncbi:NADPH-dependent 2,4-dienoyl-CoA reductase/sulfur reductase-like enzyme [Streptomyces sp. TE33382]